MIIFTEWDPNQQQEVLRSIPEDQSWSKYRENWKPTWQLRNTKVLDANLQFHTDILHLVPERKVYPKGSRWIHDMVYSRSMAAAYQGKESLRSDFHDLNMIWSEGGDIRRVYHKYFCINRPRNTHWPIMTNNAALCPRNDPNLIFPDTIYNFEGYKKLWWDILNVDGKNETHHTKLKFGSTGAMQRNQQCDWLQDWWINYGVNKTTIDHVYYESYSKMQVNLCFENNNFDCFHIPCKIVRDIHHLSKYEILDQCMTRHYEWLVMTRIKHQIVLNKPMIVRRIYTMHGMNICIKNSVF